MTGGMRVPLVFFGSKPLARFNQTRFAVQLDIAPTLTDLAGLDFPSSWQGQSLLRKRINPWSCHFSVQDWRGREGSVVWCQDDRILKYSRKISVDDEDPGSLYDIQKDPGENHNLVGEVDSDLLAKLRDQAHRH